MINSTNQTVASSGDVVASYLPWTNPLNLISFDTYQKTLYYFNTVVKPVVVIVGVPTNIISCIVFKRQGLCDRMNLCLFVLALVDMTYLAYSMVFTIALWIKVVQPVVGEELYMKALYYALGVSHGWREASALVGLVIAVERCICVVFPLQAGSLMRTRTMGLLLATAVTSMQVGFVTWPVKQHVFSVYDNTTGQIRWKTELASQWQSSSFLMSYTIFEDTVMLVLVPILNLILVTVATGITVIRLKAVSSWRKEVSSFGSEAHVQQVALTKMLVLVSCVYIGSKLPWIVVMLASVLDPDFSDTGHNYNIYKVSQLMAQLFSYVNSAVTFFIYLAQSSRFKVELRVLFSCFLPSAGVSETKMPPKI
ncbi:uncharacterized protein LOC112565947 [Pomacea canaliculata]|uniref:uncharacterized protein LOC112565947 n=1 Tax=Pomacea canaliculata TaxID=400727 RepID=UPI000D7326F1|nr:uncharacterized protein LOC112565947 [Pomacea canaliculata]